MVLFFRTIEVPLEKQNLSRENLEEIKDILFKYHGESSVLFRVNPGQGTEYLISAHHNFRVTPCNDMLREMEAVVGQKVICRYGKKNSNNRHTQHP